MKRISYNATVASLKGLFKGSEQDSLTPTEIYEIAGRDMTRPDQNKKWLQNRLTSLKVYGFVKTIYSDTRPKTVDRVQLTEEGKQALQSNTDEIPSSSISLESIARDIKQFEKQNPSIKVNFSTEIRNEFDV